MKESLYFQTTQMISRMFKTSWWVIGCGAAILVIMLLSEIFQGARQSRTIGQVEFEERIIEPLLQGHSCLSSIEVHPEIAENSQWVTGRRTEIMKLHRDSRDPSSPLVDAEVTTEFKFNAAVPYVPVIVVDKKGGMSKAISDVERKQYQYASVSDYFAAMAAYRPNVVPRWKYLWWEGHVFRISAVMAGAMLVTLPAVVVLLNAWLAARRSGPPVDNAISQDQGAHVIDIASVPGVLPVQESPHEASRLTGGAVESCVSELDPEAKDYRGEFYPTTVHRRDNEE